LPTAAVCATNCNKYYNKLQRRSAYCCERLGESSTVRGRKEEWAGEIYIKRNLMIGGTEIKEDMMGWPCGTYGGLQKCR
jgi:hypothetical protein